MKHSSTADEGIKSQKGSGLGDLDYLEPYMYRIGTSGVKAIPNPYENWWVGSSKYTTINGVTICPEIGPTLAISV